MPKSKHVIPWRVRSTYDFAASHGIYGAPRVFLDLREARETCSKHRVASNADRPFRQVQISGIARVIPTYAAIAAAHLAE